MLSHRKIAGRPARITKGEQGKWMAARPRSNDLPEMQHNFQLAQLAGIAGAERGA